MTTLETVSHLSDSELLAEVKSAVESERHAATRLIALLAHVDARRLYLGEGCSSLFTYCTQVLHLSEHAAYGRIEAARVARRFPLVLDLLARGAITLTTITLLAPHLTSTNHGDVLNEARHKSKRDVEHLVARLRPQPAVAATVRKLPATPVTKVVAAPLVDSHSSEEPPVLAPPAAHRATVMPLAPERYKVQFTVSRDTHDKLCRAQDLLRHSIPNGDPAAIFDRALTLLLVDLERLRPAPSATGLRQDYGGSPKLQRRRRPRGVSDRGWDPASSEKGRRGPAKARPDAVRRQPSGSRHIPAAVKREVWKRDGGQCAFVGGSERCTERGFLEFHHVKPYADGGATSIENLELRCRAHNMYEAELYFGSRLPLLAREVGERDYFIRTRSRPSG